LFGVFTDFELVRRVDEVFDPVKREGRVGKRRDGKVEA
jgi:hypothetical protein